MISINFSSSCLFAQGGGTAVPFLTIVPSALSRGMGNVGASLMESDAYSMYHNPALLGISDNQSEIMNSFNLTAPKLNMMNWEYPRYFSIALQSKFNLKKNENDLPLSIGIGYINQSIDLGTFVRYGSDGRELGKYKSKEWSNTVSAAAVMNYWIRFGLGFNLKFVNSELSNVNFNIAKPASGTAIDFGVFANLPVLQSYKISDIYDFNLDLTIATVISNLGPALDYVNESDPLPRTSKLSYTVTSGIDARILKSKFNALVLNWSAEVEDLLVARDSIGYNYKTIYSGTNVIDNLILLKSAYMADVRHGFRVSLMNTFQFYLGYFSGPGFSKNSETTGWAIQTTGLFKVLDAYLSGSFTAFLVKHIDIAYYKVQSDTKFPYSDFSVINLSYKNF
jgi:hypothetical protein